MLVRYKSLGAAKSVTGSRHYFEVNNFKLLVDCGLFQGLKELRLRNWDEFPVDPKEIDAIVLSHAHIDHSGYLPKIVKMGFNGPIYCTTATAALLKIMLIDSAKLQEEEAEWAYKKGYSVHERPEPLYTEKDAEKVFPLLNTIHFNQILSISPEISVKFLNAGHILGAAITEFILHGENQEKKIVYTGDLGRQNDPLLFPPQPIETADILLVESTYGNRTNRGINAKSEMARIINETYEEGCVIVPAFSVGRTQNILYLIRELILEKEIENIPIYIDSPMAISVTDLYKSFAGIQKLRPEELENHESVFDFKAFHYIRNQVQSAAINEKKSKAIIISASGMCTGGRILHHLFHRLPREKDTIMLVGYQAEGSRGRRLQDGEKMIRIFGQDVEVKARIEVLEGLSAHADMDELMEWIGTFKDSPKMTFAVHGELEASLHFAGKIKARHHWNVFVPNYMDSYELFNGI